MIGARKNRRGSTLIEMMIAVAIFGSTAGITLSAFHSYQRAADRGYRIEGLARVLDVEMERFRACADVACTRSMLSRTATTAGLSDASNTWVRARVSRETKPGPDGSTEVILTAEADETPPQQLRGLIWVQR